MTDGIGHEAGSIRAASPAGQRARHVARQAAAGDVGDPADLATRGPEGGSQREEVRA